MAPQWPHMICLIRGDIVPSHKPANALMVVMQQMQTANGSKICPHMGSKINCPMPMPPGFSTGCCLKNCDESGSANSISAPLFFQYITSRAQSNDLFSNTLGIALDSFTLTQRVDQPGLRPPILL